MLSASAYSKTLAQTLQENKQRVHYILENGSLGFIETLHKQHCLRPLAYTRAELCFQIYHNGLNDPVTEGVRVICTPDDFFSFIFKATHKTIWLISTAEYICLNYTFGQLRHQRKQIQLTLVISTLLISNNRLSRSENLVPD